MQILTGGPSFPGKPCIPFFPWGPYETKVGQITTPSPQSERSNYKCLTFSPGSPTNPWGPGKPCGRDGALVFVCIYTPWLVFVSVCLLLIPQFQGFLAVQVRRCLLGVPVTNRKWCHGKHFVIRLYDLLPLLYSLCFPLNLEPRQFLGYPVTRGRKTISGRDKSFLIQNDGTLEENVWKLNCRVHI